MSLSESARREGRLLGVIGSFVSTNGWTPSYYLFFFFFLKGGKEGGRDAVGSVAAIVYKPMLRSGSVDGTERSLLVFGSCDWPGRR